MIDNNQVIRWLIELGRQLDDATTEMADLEATAVRAKVSYEKAYAKSFLNGEGSVDRRKQQAILDTEATRLELYLADATLHACIERIRTLRSRIEVGRSINAAQRSEMAASGLMAG